MKKAGFSRLFPNRPAASMPQPRQSGRVGKEIILQIGRLLRVFRLIQQTPAKEDRTHRRVPSASALCLCSRFHDSNGNGARRMLTEFAVTRNAFRRCCRIESFGAVSVCLRRCSACASPSRMDVAASPFPYRGPLAFWISSVAALSLQTNSRHRSSAPCWFNAFCCAAVR